MANAFLRGLAIAAGTGLAVGLTSGRTKRLISAPYVPRYRVAREEPPVVAQPSYAADPEEDEFLNIEPLLDRVERLEELVDDLKQAPRAVSVPENFATALADLEQRIEENTRDLGVLREQITAAENRATQAIAQTRAEIPAIVSQTVTERIDALEKRFSLEIEQSQRRMLETFERTIDEKISSRIGAIEKTLAEQAGSIEALNARSTETDNNLQRLVSAIEKLCERTQLIPPQQQGYAPRPFEAQFNDAMRRDSVAPVVRNEEPVVEAPAFTGGEERPAKKSRFLFRNLIVAGFSVLASRFLR